MTLDPATGAVSVAPSIAVSNTSRSDMVLSPDGLTLYASGPDGNVRAYNAETGELLTTIGVGKNLGAIDVSPDGGFLMAVETKILSTTGSSWGATTRVTVYKVDLASGEVTSFPFVARDYDTTFSDVAVLADGKVLLTQNFAGSGWTDLKLLDPTTGEYEVGSSVRHGSFLSRDADGSNVLIAEADISDAPLSIYRPGEGIVDSRGGYQDGVSGFNFGFHAISGDGALVAQLIYGDGIYIFDRELDLKRSLAAAHPEWRLGEVGGIAFDPEGRFLFVLDVEADEIIQLSTGNWSVVQSIPLGFDALERDYGYGNNLLVGPDLRYFTIATSNGIHRVDNPAVADALVGTEAADTITGTAAAETLIGFDGADRLEGGLGPDTMIGGKGDDSYVVAQRTDRIVEKSGEGTDTVFASVSFALAENVEKLFLTGESAIFGVGNAGANVLVGNAAANRLNGGGGADTMRGGLGDDVYVVDSDRDRVVELADGGSDRVEASVSHILAANVEKLLLLNGAVSGSGNDLANEIQGNAANNILDGRGGADIMAGGRGDDIYFVNAGGDSVVENSGAGIDTVKSLIGYTLGENVENLTLYGGLAVNGTGNAAANILLGNIAANTLRGGGGADRLDGRGGTDSMIGGIGDDSYVVDNVGDTIIERAGAGVDTVESSVTYTLSAAVENLTLTGSDAVGGTGNGIANRLVGNDAANLLDGAGGADTISAGRGADEVYGGAGHDSIDGGDGADRIFGGVGNDVLAGGKGADGFYFDTAPKAATNVDAILDYSAAADTIHLSTAIFGSLAAGTLTEAAFALGNVASETDDRILYDGATGGIYYDADGAGGAAAVLFARVAEGTALTSADFVIYG